MNKYGTVHPCLLYQVRVLFHQQVAKFAQHHAHPEISETSYDVQINTIVFVLLTV